MRATMLYGPRDVRFEERPDPTILEPTDALLRIAAARISAPRPRSPSRPRPAGSLEMLPL